MLQLIALLLALPVQAVLIPRNNEATFDLCTEKPFSAKERMSPFLPEHKRLLNHPKHKNAFAKSIEASAAFAKNSEKRRRSYCNLKKNFTLPQGLVPEGQCEPLFDTARKINDGILKYRSLNETLEDGRDAIVDDFENLKKSAGPTAVEKAIEQLKSEKHNTEKVANERQYLYEEFHSRNQSPTTSIIMQFIDSYDWEIRKNAERCQNAEALRDKVIAATNAQHCKVSPLLTAMICGPAKDTK